MSVSVFVDTNVLLYARDASESVKQARAAAWLEELWREQRGRTSIQVLSEYYVNATKKLSPGLDPEEAWDDVKNFFAWKPAPIDQALVEAGREIERRYRLHWWDCLIVAAAQSQDCGILLTEDLQDGIVIGSVAVRSPFTLDVKEADTLYLVRTAKLAGHPKRGRPRTKRRAALGEGK